MSEYIYFFEATGKDMIKIGRSKLPHVRLAHVGYESGLDLNLLGVIPGGSKIEKQLHRRFASLKLPTDESLGAGGSEWFSDGDELRSFIDANCTPITGTPMVIQRTRVPKVATSYGAVGWDLLREAVAESRKVKKELYELLTTSEYDKQQEIIKNALTLLDETDYKLQDLLRLYTLNLKRGNGNQ